MNSAAETSSEPRRAGRQGLNAVVPVMNAMTQRVLGLTRDISMGGLQLRAAEPLVEDALYQVQVELRRKSDGTRLPVEAGVQVIRQYRAADGSILVGMRFIHLDGTNNGRLAAWLDDAAQPR